MLGATVMAGFLSDLAYTALMTLTGTVLGWWLHRCLRDSGQSVKKEFHVAQQVLSRLQDLATHMADNMGRHSSRVEQINQELNLAQAGNPEAVVSAVAQLIAANQQMQEQLKTTESKLHEQAQLVETRSAEARTDALTTLPNRRAFDDELNRRFAEFRRYQRPFSLIMGDVDHFKRFNDEYGHQSGDEVLQGVARVMRTAARQADLVARYGGEEFAVILPDTACDTGVKCLERIRQSVDTVRFRLLSGEVHVTLSFGLAEARGGEDPAALIRRADEALYASKEAGRNRGSWHDGKTIHAIAGPAARCRAAPIRRPPRRCPPRRRPPRRVRRPPPPRPTRGPRRRTKRTRSAAATSSASTSAAAWPNSSGRARRRACC